MFLDAGGARFSDDEFYDPFLRTVRNPQLYPFEAWDSENNRLQDVRASYGFGFNVFFAGLQFHWVWARRIEYTQYLPENPLDPFSPLVKTKAETGGTRSEFYLVYDW